MRFIPKMSDVLFLDPAWYAHFLFLSAVSFLCILSKICFRVNSLRDVYFVSPFPYAQMCICSLMSNILVVCHSQIATLMRRSNASISPSTPPLYSFRRPPSTHHSSPSEPRPQTRKLQYTQLTRHPTPQ
ncbi:hypothetical protein B0J14DRAFT_596747 [Halenospora varia]|nr:hypothetical protein B0J14DRAFT_596747 [Halenospora varia]